MGAYRNLSESEGWQKPAGQSKFRCVIIKIGTGPGFWKAALRITPYFREHNLSTPSDAPGTALSTGWCSQSGVRHYILQHPVPRSPNQRTGRELC